MGKKAPPLRGGDWKSGGSIVVSGASCYLSRAGADQLIGRRRYLNLALNGGALVRVRRSELVRLKSNELSVEADVEAVSLRACQRLLHPTLY